MFNTKNVAAIGVRTPNGIYWKDTGLLIRRGDHLYVTGSRFRVMPDQILFYAHEGDRLSFARIDFIDSNWTLLDDLFYVARLPDEIEEEGINIEEDITEEMCDVFNVYGYNKQMRLVPGIIPRKGVITKSLPNDKYFIKIDDPYSIAFRPIGCGAVITNPKDDKIFGISTDYSQTKGMSIEEVQRIIANYEAGQKVCPIKQLLAILDKEDERWEEAKRRRESIPKEDLFKMLDDWEEEKKRREEQEIQTLRNMRQRLLALRGQNFNEDEDDDDDDEEYDDFSDLDEVYDDDEE